MSPVGRLHDLHQLESVPGAHADVLLPIYPVQRDQFEEELALGYEGALAASNAFWDSRKPPSAASFITPERQVNETIRQNLRLTGIVAERDPETGFTSLLTGSWAYADLWATPGCMQIAMFLDSMGYHEDARRYLRMYIDDQGSVVPVVISSVRTPDAWGRQEHRRLCLAAYHGPSGGRSPITH